jgi:two-component system sensor histidine kinase VicK
MNNILLLLEDRKKHQMLVQQLGQQYQIFCLDHIKDCVQTSPLETDLMEPSEVKRKLANSPSVSATVASLINKSFDLCIVDQPALKRYRTQLQARKALEQPALLPILGIVSALPLTSDDELVVDDIITTPFEPVELSLRVQSLLRSRVFSVELQGCITQQRCRPQEENFRLLIEGVRDYAIFMLDPTGHVISWNKGAEDIMGYQADEILGAHFSYFYTPEAINAQKPAQEMQLVLTAGQCEDEGVRVRRSGEPFWANMTITAVQEQQTLVGFSVVIHDLSERKKIEEELCHANRFLRLLCDCNQVLVRVTHESDLLKNICQILVKIGRYRACWVGLTQLNHPLSVQPVAQFSTGHFQVYSPGQFSQPQTYPTTEIGSTPVDIAIHTGRPCVVENIQTDARFPHLVEDARQQGYASVIALPLNATTEESAGLSCLGVLTLIGHEPDTFNLQQVRFLQELADDLAYGIVALRTRTANLKAQAALRESEERYRRLVELSPEAIIVHRDGKIVFINPAGAALLGAHRATQLIGRSFLDFVHPDYQDIARSRIQTCLEQGEAVPFIEQKFVQLDGTEVHIESASTFFLDQAKSAILTVSRDLTERKVMEKALRRSEELHRLTLDNIAESVLLTNNLGYFTYICPNIHLTFGYTFEEVRCLGHIRLLLGQNFLEFLEQTEFINAKDSELTNIEWEIKDKTGQSRTLLISIKHVFINGGTLLYTCRDISERVQAETALKQSEERLRQVLETLPIGVWVTDCQGQLIQGNPAGTEIWAGARYVGVEPEQEHREWWAESGLPVIPEEWALFRAITHGETSINEVIDIECFDGQRKTILNSAVPLRSEKGEISGAIVVNQDITELRRIQQALQSSNRRIVNILESIMDGFFTLDHQWNFTYCNPQAEQLLKRSRQELLGKCLWQAFPESIDLLFFEKYHQAIRTGIAVSFEEFFPPLHCWFEVHAYPSEDGLAVYFQDITERKKASEALLESVQHLRAVFDAALDAMLVVDETGHYVSVNPAGGILLGLSPSEILGRHISEFVAEPNFDFTQAWQHFLTQGRMTSEILLRRADGTIIEADYSAVANFLPGRHLSVLRDISERKRTEQELRQYREQLEELVEARTAELKHTNEQLSQEIRRRSAIEVALRESSEQLRTLINAMPDIVCFKDAQGRWQEANEAILQVFQLDPHHFKGKTDLELAQESHFSHDALIYCYETDQVAWQQTTLSRVEEIIPQPNGTHKVYDVIKVPLLHPDGTPKGLVVLGRDITERKQAEEELMRLAAIVESSDDAIVSETLNGIALSWNLGAQKIYGYSAEEMKGRAISILAPPDHPYEMPRILERVRQGGRLEHYETMRLRKDGQLIHVSLTISPIKDAAGNITGVSTISRDITDRKRIEAALEQLRHQNELILNSAGDGICGLDAHGKTTFINPAALRMLGYELKQILGQQIHIILERPLSDHPNSWKYHSMNMAKHPHRLVPAQEIIGSYSHLESLIYASLKDGSVHHVTNSVFWRKDGMSFPVEYVSTPILEQGKIVGAVITFKDITERLAVERMKDEFISVVSHELRTPLTSMRGALGLLAAGLLNAHPDKAQRMLDIALRNTDRLVRLINDILDLERIQSGKIAIHRERCHIGELMVQAAETMRAMAEKAGVTLSVVPVEIWMNVDPDRLLQTFTNLLSNAIKFSQKETTVWFTGEITPVSSAKLPTAGLLAASSESEWSHSSTQPSLPLNCLDASQTPAHHTAWKQPIHQHSVSIDPLPPQLLILRVKDQGRGIPAGKLETIFERFQQVDSSDSRQKGGTGLGLAICRSIIHQHGGRIWAESNLGVGSTFCLTLPIYHD